MALDVDFVADHSCEGSGGLAPHFPNICGVSSCQWIVTVEDYTGLDLFREGAFNFPDLLHFPFVLSFPSFPSVSSLVFPHIFTVKRFDARDFKTRNRNRCVWLKKLNCSGLLLIFPVRRFPVFVLPTEKRRTGECYGFDGWADSRL